MELQSFHQTDLVTSLKKQKHNKTKKQKTEKEVVTFELLHIIESAIIYFLFKMTFNSAWEKQRGKRKLECV